MSASSLVSPTLSSTLDTYFVPKPLRKTSSEISLFKKESLAIPFVALPYFLYVLAKKAYSAVADIFSKLFSKNNDPAHLAHQCGDALSADSPEGDLQVADLGDDNFLDVSNRPLHFRPTDIAALEAQYSPRAVIRKNGVVITFF